MMSLRNTKYFTIKNTILFYINNGNFKLSFTKDDKPKSNEWEIIDAIHTEILHQNDRKTNEEKILLVPSFYASKLGLIIISTLAVVQSIVIIVSLVIKSKLTFGLYFFSNWPCDPIVYKEERCNQNSY